MEYFKILATQIQGIKNTNKLLDERLLWYLNQYLNQIKNI